MTRDEHLAEAVTALRPVGDLLLKGRMGVAENFSPIMVQIALEYAKVNALAALAAGGGSFSGELLELAVHDPGITVQQQSPESSEADGCGLIVPGSA